MAIEADTPDSALLQFTFSASEWRDLVPREKRPSHLAAALDDSDPYWRVPQVDSYSKIAVHRDEFDEIGDMRHRNCDGDAITGDARGWCDRGDWLNVSYHPELPKPEVSRLLRKLADLVDRGIAEKLDAAEVMMLRLGPDGKLAIVDDLEAD